MSTPARVDQIMSHLVPNPTSATTHAFHHMSSPHAPAAEGAKPSLIIPHFRSLGVSEALIQLLLALLDSAEAVSLMLRETHVSGVGTANAFGDHQLTVDVKSDDIVFQALKASGICATASSEENPVEVDCTNYLTNGPDAECYSVSFDPLDGSSVIDANLSVGSIFAVFKGRGLAARHGRDIVASMITIYGPRTTACISVNGKTFGFTLDENSETEDCWVMAASKEPLNALNIKQKATTFAPANLRCAAESLAYEQLVNYYIQNKYTLRYTGALVPDIYHILIKGQGIFMSPVTEKSKAKLRLLYEVYAIAHIVECAGGAAVNELGQRILDLNCNTLEQRTGLIAGSKDEVKRYIDFHKL